MKELKELREVSLVVRRIGYGSRGAVVTPKMLESRGVSVSVDTNHLGLSGKIDAIEVSLRGLLDDITIATSPIQSIRDNVATTLSGSHYFIQSISADYLELCSFEQEGGTILFDWCLGLDHNNKVHMSAKSYSNGKFSYIDKMLDSKNHNKVSLEGEEFFVIWDSLNFCEEFKLSMENGYGEMSQSFLFDTNPEDLYSVAQLMSVTWLDPNYYDPKTSEHLLNIIFG